MKSISLKAEPIHFLEVLAFPLALFHLSPHLESLYLGAALGIVGLFLKLWLFAYPKKKNRKFEVYGPYRFLRHPYFCSTLILICAAAMTSRSLVLFLVLMSLFAIIFLKEAPGIDQTRQDVFGGEYLYYKACISSLVPGLIPYPAVTQKDPSLRNLFDVRFKAEIDSIIATSVFYGYVFAYLEFHQIRSYHFLFAGLFMGVLLLRLGRLIQWNANS
ncbi:hypothetical protein [Pseudobacteriovorax antillogorgiicola]|uniref:Protein-S-isoprenylcysteine O-methyltransferase Ste14 n=1 Tax=Pseudobacteriovorax antillogorgiicola TaxID=1513793 RepID=A0A1Y6C5H1_9BACT|nr:hypothetical protein [Pseudobacteriovorax antillogorgiicola]TCS49431.1 hypothetical protein EDD56_115112 [Pseudobacteriovorax antillogorgiicola]SMF46693.1 hypothetical protein SAMN06296036_11472 [Pseudobacteriovorax antillogorgiicola]